MNPFKHIRNNAKKILSEKRINRIIKEVVLRYKQTIIDTINQEQLINKGITGEGESIASFQPYTQTTIAIKKSKGQRHDIVTLDDTGKKYQKSKVKSIKEGFSIYSTVDYFEDLEEKYGPEIFQMTKENLEDFTKFYIIPRIVEENKKILA